MLVLIEKSCIAVDKIMLFVEIVIIIHAFYFQMKIMTDIMEFQKRIPLKHMYA